MQRLERNREYIEISAKHLIAPIEEADVQEYYVGSDGEFDFFQTGDGVPLGLKDEADGSFSPNPQVRELIFIIGIYGSREIEQIVDKANPKTMIFVIEPKLSWLLRAMEHKDMAVLARPNVVLIAQRFEALPKIIEQLFSSPALFLAANLRIYATYYYRVYGIGLYKEVFKVISTILKYKLFTIGNSIDDSLVGIRQNIANIRSLPRSKDISKLKNAFRNVPAIIVAAGPSVEKNMHLLKEAKGKALIIAADTITARLRREGIVPDFICTIERDLSIYDFFYKDKDIPPEVTLVAPPVIVPRIIENFAGNVILPMRDSVREYFWLQEVLGLNNDYVISMGSSCAHLAFGLAAHMGAHPIVLVGQDLAYAEDGERTHSLGTVYDEQNINPFTVPKIAVEGYYGGTVLSNEFWIAFRNWIELEIITKQITVINATEGGSKIEHTSQQPLRSVIDTYCRQEIDVLEVLAGIPGYQLDDVFIRTRLRQESDKITAIGELARRQQQRLERLKLSETMSQQAMEACLETFRIGDEVLHAVYDHQLVMHAIQGEILHMMHRFYNIEERLAYDTLRENFIIQKNFVYVVEKVTGMIAEALQTALAD